MTSGTATLSWFARHELTLAWRDWAQMMAGGRGKRERAVVIGTIVFAGLLHWLAYVLLAGVVSGGVDVSKPTLVLMTGIVLLSFSMMLSQAIEHVTRSFYARADLDLILSSPASAKHLFAIRIASIALVGTAMTSLLAAPAINAAAIAGGAHWLLAYGVIVALSAIATGLALMASIALFQWVGPKRTRLIAQIIAAVVGAALVIGLQVAAIVTYGNLSRLDVLRSGALVEASPDEASLVWLPARALLGDTVALALFVVAALLFLTIVIAVYAGRLSANAIATAGSAEDAKQHAIANRPFRKLTTAEALRAKEWSLLRRDPWLASQTLMQLLYLLPPALLLWRDMGASRGIEAILAPVLVMAFGQLAGGLTWLAISGEDAPDLVATAPIQKSALTRAKIEAVMVVIAAIAAPLLIALAFVSMWGAAMAVIGVVAASMSAIAIQIWYKVSATRSQFRRRQTASKISTFAEALSSIHWAAAAGFAAAGTWSGAIAFFVISLMTVGLARFLAPRG